VSVGFVIGEANWGIVREGLDSSIELAFVSHRLPEAGSWCEPECPDFLVVEAHPAFLTPDLVAEVDRRGIELAALITSPDGEQQAHERGVGHFIRQPEDLIDLVARSHSSRRRERGTELSLLVSVWGATGSPGRTTVAITSATMLADKGLSVALVDADPGGGVVAASLGLLDEVPGFVAACRLAQRGELDSDHIHRLVSRYHSTSGQVDVLTGLSRPLRDVDAPRDAVDATLATLRGCYDVIVVDVGSDLPDDSPTSRPVSDGTELTAQLLEEADCVWAVIEATPVGVTRFARVKTQFDQARGSTPVTFLTNKVDPTRRSLGDDAVIGEALWRFAQVSDYRRIPRDCEHSQQSRMRGQSISVLGGKQPIVAALQPEVDELAELIRARQQRLSPERREKSRAEASPRKWAEKLTRLRALR
jgi:MinD-like ATPase involved in chromosome partitioning or flagellar assembly